MTEPPARIPLSTITLGILAGGASRRMGSNKADLRIGGQLVLDRLMDQFDWPGPTMLVIAPAKTPPAASRRFDRIVSDPIAGMGPLRGVLTLLEQMTTEWAVVTTVDMPGVNQAHLRWLAEQIDGHQLYGMMCERGDGGERSIEPFPAVYHRSAAVVIESQLTAGRRAVHLLIEQAGFLTVRPPATWKPDVWTNLNTPEDMRRFSSE